MQRRLACTTLVGAMLLAADRAHAAAGDDELLQASPSAVPLAPGEAADILLVLRNPRSAPLGDCQLTSFTVTDVQVPAALPKGLRLEPNDRRAWPVRILQASQGRMTGTLDFRLDCARLAKSDPGGVPGGRETAIVPIEIQERAPEPIEKIAELRIETTLDELDDHHPGLIFLVVKNISSVALTITGIATHQPDFMKLTVPGLTPPATLLPQASTLYSIPVSVDGKVQTGKHRVVLEVAASWTKSGRPGAGSLVAAHTVNVGVFGESALLQLVGIPSLLFLPGFLLLSTFALLWTRVIPAKKSKTDGAALSVPELTLLSITLSLLAALAYPRITAALGAPRDYLYRYGLVDVFYVWLGSVTIGAVAWVGVVGGGRLWRRIVRYREDRTRARSEQERLRRTPATTDTPLAILDKLTLNGVAFPLKQVEVLRDGSQQRAFLILPGHGAKDSPGEWAAPPFVVRQTRTNDDGGGLSAEWQKQLEDAGKLGPQQLAEALRRADPALEASWVISGPLKGPTLMTGDEIKKREGFSPLGFFELD